MGKSVGWLLCVKRREGVKSKDLLCPAAAYLLVGLCWQKHFMFEYAALAEFNV